MKKRPNFPIIHSSCRYKVQKHSSVDFDTSCVYLSCVCVSLWVRKWVRAHCVTWQDFRYLLDLRSRSYKCEFSILSSLPSNKGTLEFWETQYTVFSCMQFSLIFSLHLKLERFCCQWSFYCVKLLDVNIYLFPSVPYLDCCFAKFFSAVL